MLPGYDEHIRSITARWNEALALAGFDSAVITAGSPRMYFQDDQAMNFRANPDFAQFVPTDACMDAALLLRRGERPRLFFLAPEDYWHAPPVPPGWVTTAIDMEVFAEPESLRNALARAVATSGKTVLMSETADSNLGCTALNDSRVKAMVHHRRAIKTPFEMHALRQATATAVKGHIAARQSFADGGSEFDINQAYLQASSQVAGELPYGNIIALNEHAAVLHYPHFDRSLPAERYSFLIDAGARSYGYAADITRTYAHAEGAVQREFADLISAFDKVQLQLASKVRPGVDFLDLHIATHQAVAETLCAFDVVTTSADEVFARGITRAFLPHGLGHLVGIQTHDVGGHQVAADGRNSPPPAIYPSLRLTRTLETGFVFTVEPGLYFIPLLLKALRAGPDQGLVNWKQVDRFSPCGGIRIEDNVVVTDSGHENYTRAAFASAELTRHG
jgi:Xaa-Pro dipeptidase